MQLSILFALAAGLPQRRNGNRDLRRRNGNIPVLAASAKAPQFVPASAGAVSLEQADKVVSIATNNLQSGDSKNLLDAADQGLFPTGFNQLLPVQTRDFCAPLVGQANIEAVVGAQFKKGGVSCSSDVQGMIPAIENMVSTIIVEPKAGTNFDASKDNTLTVQINNLVSGFFSNANAMYYLTPQTLSQGKVQGHQHVVVQQLNGDTVPNPREFQFFKGINQVATDPQGNLLTALIPAGTFVVNGLYRFCSITGANTHQPILSPILERGFQDDCVRVNVINAKSGSTAQAKGVVASALAAIAKTETVAKATGLEAPAASLASLKALANSAPVV